MDDEVCNTTLGLGLNQCGPKRDNPQKTKRVLFHNLSIPLYPLDPGISISGSSLKVLGEDEKESSKEDDESNHSKNCSRKKLRLNRYQITLLEDSFRQHSSLNMAQKQALAEKLNLKLRQVEVWFQNRRARTKLKQTEADCKFLRKTCERLSEENRRLNKELLELRSAMMNIEKPSPPPPVPPAPAEQPYFSHILRGLKLKTCPSCE